MTELRVHGVGGTPPDATLGDLAPEQVSGDAIAGFYRSSDHQATEEDKDVRLDVDRHVEVYSWGGLTSHSKVRLLWLALLPFLFGNLAGWMCSARTRESAWRFRLHRLAYGLGTLVLTVNAALIAVMISADVLAYQASRAGLAGHQWWLAPLGWHFVAGHPTRQVTVGIVVVLLFVLALTWLASRTWRYEAVRPPYQVKAGRKEKARMVTAATLPGGLADDEFWDGESSVRLISWLHVGVAGGFLAIVLGVTAKALAGSPHVIALAWIAIGLGAATVALGTGYVCLDALSTPPVDRPAGQAQGESWLSDELRGWLRFLPVPAAAALAAAGLFAWLQPGGPAGRAADLPGMASVTGWTTLAIAVSVAVALISMLLGLSGKGTLTGGPWVTLMLGFGTLNIVLLGAEIWVAHLVGPVTSNAADALSRPQGKIYLPYVITSGVPLVVWAGVLAVLLFGLTEFVRWLRTRQLPGEVAEQYRHEAATFRDLMSLPLNAWYWSGLDPFPPPGYRTDDPGAGEGWEQKIARAQFTGRAPHDATWLLWGIILAQLVMALCVWQLHVQPPVVVRNLGILLIGLALPTLMAFLYSAWNDPAKRRTIGVLWDVGTFWPRSYHPLSPPCYTERAIPDLQRRMWWLHDNGGRVMLVAHSQGAMLATAALVQPGCRPEDDRPALITFGSPVCKLYSWGFPAYVDRNLLEPLESSGSARLSGWRNFYYPTDPIGGPVAPDLSAAGGDPVDQEFLDPAECYYVYGQAPPTSQGHSGYWADPRVWERINTVAAGGRPISQIPAARTPRPELRRRAPALTERSRPPRGRRAPARRRDTRPRRSAAGYAFGVLLAVGRWRRQRAYHDTTEFANTGPPSAEGFDEIIRDMRSAPPPDSPALPEQAREVAVGQHGETDRAWLWTLALDAVVSTEIRPRIKNVKAATYGFVQSESGAQLAAIFYVGASALAQAAPLFVTVGSQKFPVVIRPSPKDINPPPKGTRPARKEVHESSSINTHDDVEFHDGQPTCLAHIGDHYGVLTAAHVVGGRRHGRLRRSTLTVAEGDLVRCSKSTSSSSCPHEITAMDGIMDAALIATPKPEHCEVARVEDRPIPGRVIIHGPKGDEGTRILESNVRQGVIPVGSRDEGPPEPALLFCMDIGKPGWSGSLVEDAETGKMVGMYLGVRNFYTGELGRIQMLRQIEMVWGAEMLRCRDY